MHWVLGSSHLLNFACIDIRPLGADGALPQLKLRQGRPRQGDREMLQVEHGSGTRAKVTERCCRWNTAQAPAPR
jgi:hypothetical protein